MKFILLSTKFTCNSSSIARPKSCSLQAKFFPGYTTDTLIRRKSSIRTKHESTTRKSTKYTLSNNKLTSQSAFIHLRSRSTFAVQQHERTVWQRMPGAFTHLARYPRVLVSRNPYPARIYMYVVCACGASKTFTLFVTKICYFPYTIYDLPTNLNPTRSHNRERIKIFLQTKSNHNVNFRGGFNQGQ